jgi:hypothetical protein
MDSRLISGCHHSDVRSQGSLWPVQLRLQQQQMLLRSKLDRVYEDRLSDAISDELWTTKSGELQEN